MKFSLESISQHNHVYSYGEHYLVIKSSEEGSLQRFETNLILTPQTIIDSWRIGDIDQLTDDDIDLIIRLDPELLIWVTGSGLSSATQRISSLFSQHHIGTEFMSLGAACRTYNLLLNEGRKVVLAICCF